MLNLKKLIRQNQLTSFKRNNFLRLDKNERSFKFENKILNKIKDLISSSLIQSYPENIYDLKKIISKKENIDSRFISITPGADGALKYIFELFKSNKTKNIVTLFPTYAMLEVYSKIFQFKLKKIPRSLSKDISNKDFIKHSANFIYLANPNMPDGQIIEKEQILSLLKKLKRKKILLVIDETYINFSSHDSLKDLVKRHKNLIIIKSLSKSLGIAGLRLGYLIANPNYLSLIDKIKPLADISSLSAEIAIVLLKNKKYQKDYLEEIEKSKKFVKVQCQQLDLDLIETETNFFHLIFKNKFNEIQKKLEQNKILVRKNRVLINNNFQKTLRITYSNRKNMNFFFKKLKIVLNKI